MSFRNKLQEHAESWIRKGIISEGQKDAMLADIQTESSAGKLFSVFAIIGSLFIGAGILLIISSNWPHLPKLLKLILILSMPIIPTGIGYYLSYVRSEFEKIGNASLFLGALLVGASLALLGQLYNLDGSIGGLLVWWMLLTLPFTLIFRFRAFAALTAVLLYTSMFYLLMGGDRWWRLNEEQIQFMMRMFTAVPLAVIVLGEVVRKEAPAKFIGIFKTFEIISLKVLFGALFIGLIADGELSLFGESSLSLVIQNALFLLAVFSVMWIAITRHNDLVRHSTFFWLGLYMIEKYFAWFWSYMDTGLFFVIFGGFLLSLVYGYIRFSRYMKEVKEGYRKEILDGSAQSGGNASVKKHGE